jgi:hypothetical protein
VKSHPWQGGRWLGALGLPAKESRVHEAGNQEPGGAGARCSPPSQTTLLEHRLGPLCLEPFFSQNSNRVGCIRLPTLAPRCWNSCEGGDVGCYAERAIQTKLSDFPPREKGKGPARCV